MVKIYYTNKTLEEKFIQNNFSKQINNHILQKQNIKSRKSSQRTWELLRMVFLKEFLVEIKNLDIIFNENGKPITEKYYFSISHSNNVSIVAISDNKIGIDIQEIKITNKIKKLASRLLKDKENLDIEKFYKAFASYEALIKYNGDKIGYPKNKLALSDDCFTKIIELENIKYVIAYKTEIETEIIEY